jgi:aminoglycoside phosphotransferase (APT) family kinase protein
MTDLTQNLAQSADELSSALSKAFGSSVENLFRMSAGASQEIWSFDVPANKDMPQLVLRRSHGGIARLSSAQLSLADEAGLLEAAARNGVPVPQIARIFGPDAPDNKVGDGYVMERIEGETIPRKILRDDAWAKARTVLARQCGKAAAGIHKIDPGELKGLSHLSPATQIENYFTLYDEFGDPHPVFELAFRWLGDNMPKEAPERFVHGDFRHGNIVVGPEGLVSVLDWELAHLGDPMADLGWICVNSWRFGEVHNPVGGFGTREDLFAGYEEGGGTVDASRVHFWEVFGTLKWGIMCKSMVIAFRTGFDQSVERAAIGRRSSETEVDLLNLLAGA